MADFSRRGLLGDKKKNNTKGTLDYIHFDLLGTTQVPSKEVMIDDFSIKV